MSRERDGGPHRRAGRKRSSTIELQQGMAFIPSEETDGTWKQYCVRCNSNAKDTCPGAKTHLLPAPAFPKGATYPSVSALLVLFGGRMGTTTLASDEDKRRAPMKIRAENKWYTPAPKGSGPGASEESSKTTPTTEPTASEQHPLAEFIGSLLGGTEDFRNDEKALKSLAGAGDAKWLNGRTRLAPTYERGTFSQSPATDLLKCLIAAVLSSPEGNRVFAWFSAERKTTEAGSVARGAVGNASSHALGFITTQAPPGFDDEELSSLLALSILPARDKSLSGGHVELAARALRELCPDGAPVLRTDDRISSG